MKSNRLLICSIIRTVFVAVESAALIVALVITFSNDGTAPWGYWGGVLAVFAMFGPIFVYIIASAIFNGYNMNLVIKKRHTYESVKKYHIASIIYLTWGILTGVLYSGLLVPFFLLENIFLFIGYQKELDKMNNV